MKEGKKRIPYLSDDGANYACFPIQTKKFFFGLFIIWLPLIFKNLLSI